MNKKYYKKMCNFSKLKNQPTEKIKSEWRWCFGKILKNLNSSYNEDVIEDLFYSFEMVNWKDLHLENTKYKDCSANDLYNIFSSEAFYMSDRVSYDRLFRTHWLFLRWKERV